ncbi:MAG: tRNA lysidine(34) synthetase TilS [Lachnospiraceae bacterium]|nr:tRNA lysidine(34) synthetase TilS [Lachnospiraceae bacterium]
MIEKVRNYMQQYKMLVPGDTVVTGVSGGADSLCLLFMLKEFAEEMSLQLAVVHVNHGIREEAGEDAVYVEKICKELEVPFFLKETDVEAIAKSQGISTEEAGRNVRYEAFYEVLKQLNAEEQGKIAVAHNANDRAETMLFHLFRGTGLTGLSGIKPVRDRIIRPLLCLDREEIEQYLEKKEVTFCIDRTNNEDTYTRNKIRHHILPFAENNICTGAVSHMNRTAEMLLETEEFLREQTISIYSKIVEEKGNSVYVSVKEFINQPRLLQKRILLLCMEKIAAGRRDIGLVHIENILSLFTKEGNKELALPYGMLARRDFEKIFIGADSSKEIKKVSGEIEVLIPGEIEIEGIGVLEFRVFEYDKSKIIPEKTYTKWLDYDKIEKSLVLRTRQTGDYLTINKTLSKKTLKKYFIEEKIPKNERENIYVLADGSHIIWVPGHRISQYYKITSETRNILQVHLRGGS